MSAQICGADQGLKAKDGGEGPSPGAGATGVDPRDPEVIL